MKQKDLIGIPWRVAFALQADGWYLRQDIIWSKPNPMPESVTDRCTKAHEYIFLMSKSARYHYDAYPNSRTAPETWRSNYFWPASGDARHRTKARVGLHRGNDTRNKTIRLGSHYSAFRTSPFRHIPPRSDRALHQGWMPQNGFASG
jgi:hypothetical protein